MNLIIIAGYLVVSIVIYSVLTKIATLRGRLTGNVDKAIVVLSLIWPLWGEFAVLAIVVYVVSKGLQTLSAPDLQGRNQ